MRNVLLLLCKVLLISNFYSYTSLFAQQAQPTKNLPIIESKSTGNNYYYVILLTGNGGWRNLVQSVTHYLNSKNVSVLAINTKKYLRSEKKPAQIACDLEALIDRYNIKWGRRK
jgi:type IV secretory pathway VirJ component